MLVLPSSILVFQGISGISCRDASGSILLSTGVTGAQINGLRWTVPGRNGGPFPAPSISTMNSRPLHSITRSAFRTLVIVPGMVRRNGSSVRASGDKNRSTAL